MSGRHPDFSDRAREAELERSLHGWLEDVTRPLPARVKDEVVVQAAVIAQHGRWPWQRRPPQHDSGRGSPLVPLTAAVSVAAVTVVAALALLGPPPMPSPQAGFVPHATLDAQPSPEPATPPRRPATVLVVDPTGAGDHRTIGDALAAAQAGDTIRVRTGEYAESLLVDTDVSIVGDGSRDGVVLRPRPGTGQVVAGQTYTAGLLLSNTRATLQDLTLRAADGPALVVLGGAPTLRDLMIDGDDGQAGILFVDGARGTLSDSLIDGPVRVESGSSPTLRQNELRHGLVIVGPDSEPDILGNTVLGLDVVVDVGDRSDPTISGNDISATAAFSGNSTALRIAGAGADVRDNSIRGSDVGIAIDRGWPEVWNNDISGHRTIGLHVSCSEAFAGYNRIEGNHIGVRVDECVTLEDGTAWQPAMIHGNTICDNDVDLVLLQESALRAVNFVCARSGDDLRPLLKDPWERRFVQWLDQPLPGALEDE
jgi:hypothetical protein